MGVRFVVDSIEGRKVTEEIAYPFDQSRIVIGRGVGADVRIPHATVSELHATLQVEGGVHQLTDQGSTNGTRVNGARLAPGRQRALSNGDRITLGVYILTFRTGQVVTEPITAERTAELARRLLRAAREAEPLPPPRLVVLDGERQGIAVELPPAPAALLVGREADCQLVLPDVEVSRRHAEVQRDLDGVEVIALEAKNGLRINGQAVTRRRLRDGDEVLLGGTRLLFEDAAEQPLRALAGAGDHALREPPRAVPDPEPDGPTTPEAAPAQAAAPAPPAPGLDADLVIYGLAALVLLFSAAGLVWLLGAG